VGGLFDEKEGAIVWRKILLVLVTLGVLGLAGCGGGPKKVDVVVTLDDKPLEGATVTFQPTDGSGTPASGMTDSSGKVSVTFRNKSKDGNYKVTVVKSASEPAAKDMKPGSPEYLKFMEKRSKEKASAKDGETKSLVPEKYATAVKTPLECKVPSSSQPVELKLTSKLPWRSHGERQVLLAARPFS